MRRPKSQAMPAGRPVQLDLFGASPAPAPEAPGGARTRPGGEDDQAPGLGRPDATTGDLARARGVDKPVLPWDLGLRPHGGGLWPWERPPCGGECERARQVGLEACARCAEGAAIVDASKRARQGHKWSTLHLVWHDGYFVDVEVGEQLHEQRAAKLRGADVVLRLMAPIGREREAVLGAFEVKRWLRDDVGVKSVLFEFGWPADALKGARSTAP